MRTIIYALLSAWITAGSLQAAGELAKYPPAYSNVLRDAMRSFSERDFQTSLVLVDRADTLHTPTPISLNIRGAIAIEERRFEEAQTLPGRASSGSAFLPARFNLAEIPFVQGKYAEARNIFEKLQEDHPKDELLQFRIYLTYLLEKDDSAAKNALDQVPFLSNTPIYYYCHAAWQFAHGNAKGGGNGSIAGTGLPPARTRNYADVFYDLGWLTRPGAPGAAQSTPSPTSPTAPTATIAPPEPLTLQQEKPEANPPAPGLDLPHQKMIRMITINPSPPLGP